MSKTTTISLPEDIKTRAIKASKKLFGKRNLSGYIQMLITRDCDKRNIK